ncbi:uncharacterized protein TRIVIDRAFT_215894 [Trichoderma virens Gv29-8]|uniref:Uncharacterized protein n=1 Tax=Hypocrea virens (strain Gv29-8 / FGSC 10586) TaxID=413071 RepID=G9MPK4_HYPVG|nr:uncharacterized protein TRIVIDRAFT_215894 [Trichoderma virens Gv29-8]EHK23805.1 hypothetical protein TRIVIDRAFT_215894 [Trichoderma virens Gv29-8]UKZ76566.1 hypothetical protein TrVFT333_004273 [Trichoderma virens FT-333]
MVPNPETHNRPVAEGEQILPLHGALEGTFYVPPMPTGPMSMTSYVTPHMQAFPTNYAIGAPTMWAAGAPPMIFPYMIDTSGQRHDLASYAECTADSGVDQVNGVMVVCDSGANSDDLQAPRGKYYYNGCRKLGSGSQVNGIEIVYHGGSPTPTAPAMPGRWEKMDMLNADGREIKGAPKNQINGARVRLMKRSDMGASI